MARRLDRPGQILANSYWMQAVTVPMTAYESLRERDADAPAP